MQQFPGQPNKFELKNTRPNDIALAAEAANYVMLRAAQNAYLGLKPQVNSFNQAVNYNYTAPVEEVAPTGNVVNFDEYRRRNVEAQPTYVPTEPEQSTFLDEDIDDPEARTAEARDYVDKVLTDAA